MKEKSAEHGRAVSFLMNNNFVDVIKIVKKWNEEQLAEFLLNHPQIHEMLRSPELNQLWEEKRTNLRLPGNPDFRFMAQPGINDADFVMGYLLFLLKLKSQHSKNESSVSHVGVKSTDYLSMHAIRKYLHQIYIHIGQAKENDLRLIAEFLYNLEAFAKLHQCPGYLLMANGYMQLALRYQQMKSEDECTAAFKLCWKFLHMAELSEAESEESINNAYFGNGLVLSNPFKLASIAEMKSYCFKAANNYLSVTDTAGAEQSACSMYQHTRVLRSTAEEIRPSLGR